MKYTCNIIKDLLPLYHDKVCSEESCAAVLEHLSECEDCSKYLESLSSANVLTPVEIKAEKAKAAALSGLKKILFRKKVVVSVISVLCAIAVMFGAYAFISLYETPIEYEDGLVTVDMAYDGVIDAFYQGRDYHCVYGMDKTIAKDGKEINVVYIYYARSIWSEYFSRAHEPGTLQFSIGNGGMHDYGHNGEAIDSNGNISAVYYLVGDYSKLIFMDEEEFLQTAKDAVLLWER